MNTIIANFNHKGGTGKTTTSVNLGAALANLGNRVLVIDLDPQANLSQSFGIEDEDQTISDIFSRKIQNLPIRKITDKLHLVPSSLDMSAVGVPVCMPTSIATFCLKSKL